MSLQLRHVLWCLLIGTSLLPLYVVLFETEGFQLGESLYAPLIWAVVIFLGVISQILAEFRGSLHGAKGEHPSRIPLRVFLLIAAALLSLVLVSYLGFFLGTIILFVSGAALLEERRLSRYLFGIIIWAGIVYLLFSYVLMVPLPEGSFFS